MLVTILQLVLSPRRLAARLETFMIAEEPLIVASSMRGSSSILPYGVKSASCLCAAEPPLHIELSFLRRATCRPQQFTIPQLHEYSVGFLDPGLR
jgi:hypothetical protein